MENPIGHQEQPTKKSEQLREAIRSGNVEEVVRVLTEIDGVLTGGRFFPDREDIGDLCRRPDTRIKVYLGDGGTSRLLIVKKRESIDFFVADNSTRDVKEKWEEM